MSAISGSGVMTVLIADSRCAHWAMFTAWSPTRSRSFEILIDGDDEAEVARHRLLQREQVDGLILDLELERVELAVAGDHRLGHRCVAAQAAHRPTGRASDVGEIGHVEQPLLECRELVVKMAKAGSLRAAATARASSEPPGDVRLGALVRRAGEHAVGRSHLDEPPR